jgi:hypothetical protein
MDQEVEIVVRGPVGSGKSALLGEIEILMRAMRVPYRFDNPEAWQQELNLTGADWQSELERTKPVVVLKEEGLRQLSPLQISHEKAYGEGREACLQKQPVLSNPYLAKLTSNTAFDAILWMIGYNAQLSEIVDAQRGTTS